MPRLSKIYDSRIYKAVINWAERQDLWDEWKTIYATLEDDNRKENALEFFHQNEDTMMEGVKVLWPEGFPYYRVMEELIDTGRYSVNAELQNEPHDPETQIFDMVNAKRFSVVSTHDQRVLRTESGDKPLEIMRKVAFLDPALGSDSGTSYPSIAVLARDSKGYAYPLDIWMDKVPPSRQVVQCYEMRVANKAVFRQGDSLFSERRNKGY